MDILSILSQELSIRPAQAESAVALLDGGNTVPFISRYRKEATGGLSDEQLRALDTRLSALRALVQRQEDVLRLINEQGKLTPELERAVRAAGTVAEVDDLYRPYRPKRRTRASIAAERGLSPLAELLLAQKPGIDPLAEAQAYVDEEKGVATPEDALQGAMDILAEQVSDTAEYRKWIREYTYEKGTLASKARTTEDTVYRLYYEYQEPLKKIPSHRVLAVDRGEREEVLSVKITADEGWILNYLRAHVCRKTPSPSAPYVAAAAEDAYRRLIAPSVETELRNLLTERAQEQAITVFGENLRHLLMQPPLRGNVVMGFDPAYRTGCKIAVVDALGEVLDTTVVYPTPPQSRTEEAKQTLTTLIRTHKVDVISIGNGTASKESEIFVAGLIRELGLPVRYAMTNEAGASVYSASELGSREFPQFDVSLRSAVSIARRLQDPLAELVKIDPKSIGVGQYQHDMDQKRLSAALDGVVESCVSSVGADVNTASPSLLAHIAGLNARTAQSVYDYRHENGAFTSRTQLKKVKGIGEKAFTQCAGFLRVPESAEVLDNTAVHPESYAAARALLKAAGLTEADVRARRMEGLAKKITEMGWDALADALGIGVPTLRDIADELQKPGRDIRDALPQPVLRSDILDIKSLSPGMELTGTVRNVADFGAFVDIGVHQDGLVHISKLAKGFVRRAMDAVSVGDVIQVRVLEVDAAKKRISLARVFEEDKKC
ncbi:MAG: Tex family protein [Clostridiaceae bacterium]|nr:Tex family protein [Clostridiaceae bacterium]